MIQIQRYLWVNYQFVSSCFLERFNFPWVFLAACVTTDNPFPPCSQCLWDMLRRAQLAAFPAEAGPACNLWSSKQEEAQQRIRIRIYYLPAFSFSHKDLEPGTALSPCPPCTAQILISMGWVCAPAWLDGIQPLAEFLPLTAGDDLRSRAHVRSAGGNLAISEGTWLGPQHLGEHDLSSHLLPKTLSR